MYIECVWWYFYIYFNQKFELWLNLYWMFLVIILYLFYSKFWTVIKCILNVFGNNYIFILFEILNCD